MKRGNNRGKDKMSAPTLDERIDDMATEYVMNVLAKNTIPLTSEQKDELFQQARNMIVAQRNQNIQVLNEALQEIETLEWRHVQPSSLYDISQFRTKGRVYGQRRDSGVLKGIRDIYFVRFGNFVMAKESGWIYRPTPEQYMKLVTRFKSKKQCESTANRLRFNLKPFEVDGKKIEVAMDELKKDLRDQVEQLLKSV